MAPAAPAMELLLLLAAMPMVLATFRPQAPAPAPAAARSTRSSSNGCPLTGLSSNAVSGQDVPESIRDIVSGVAVPGDSGVPPGQPPSWLDRDKFLRGQAFARKHLFSIAYADIVSLYFNFLFPGELQPLIFTGRSDTPYKAFKRYLSTFSRVRSWYESDPWKEGTVAYQNIVSVRGYHLQARLRLRNATPEELLRNTTIRGDGTPPGIWSNLVERVCEDTRDALCPRDVDAVLHDGDIQRREHLNQFDMSLTQFAFTGLAMTFPERFGIHGASERDMDAFCHTWAAIGYGLGIQDKYNFNLGGLAATRQRTRDVIEYLVKPRLRNVHRDWEHMTRVLTEGLAFHVPGVSYEANLLYLLDTIGVPTRRLAATLNLNQRLSLNFLHFYMNMAMRVPSIRAWTNVEGRNSVKRTLAAPEKWHETAQRRSYRYQFLPVPRPFQCA